MKFLNRKKRKITKRKIVKCAKGSITIFLCFLLTPFLTLALSLVEYARYQEVIASINEIMGVSAYNELMNYDEYIHNRFGLLCTSQDGIGADATNTEVNFSVLGKQAELISNSMEGTYALSNEDVLLDQVLDVADISANISVYATDLALEDLLNLGIGDSIEAIRGIRDAISGVVDVVGEEKAVFETAANVCVDLGELIKAIKKVEECSEDLASSGNSLIKNLKDQTKPNYEDPVVQAAAWSALCVSYLVSVNLVAGDANDLISACNEANSQMDALSDNLDILRAQIVAIRDKLDDIDGADFLGSVLNTGSSNLIDELIDVVEKAQFAIREGAAKSFKDAMNKLKSDTLDDIGIKSVMEASGDELTATELSSLIDEAASVYNSYGDIDDDIKITNGFNWANIESGLNVVLKAFEDSIKAEGLDIRGGFIGDMRTILRYLYQFSDEYIVCDPTLNACVSSISSIKLTCHDIMVQIGSLFEKIDYFEDTKDNAKGILGAIEIVKAIYDVILQVIRVFDEVLETVDIFYKQYKNLMLLYTNPVKRYDFTTLVGYVRHNMPSRINTTANIDYDDDNNAGYVQLKGTGITGFDYDDVAREADYDMDERMSWRRIFSILDYTGLSGTHSMFKGAEMEYFLVGSNSEIVNQVGTFIMMYVFRLILDLPSVLACKQMHKFLELASKIPELITQIIVIIIIVVAYVYVEPFIDMWLLVLGQKVPLIRTSCWLTVMGALKLALKFKSVATAKNAELELLDWFREEDSGIGIGGGGVPIMMPANYDTHMLILLSCTQTEESVVERLRNIIMWEGNTYYKKQGKVFDIDKTYTAIKVKSQVAVKPLFNMRDGGLTYRSFTHTQTVSY